MYIFLNLCIFASALNTRKCNGNGLQSIKTNASTITRNNREKMLLLYFFLLSYISRRHEVSTILKKFHSMIKDTEAT